MWTKFINSIKWFFSFSIKASLKYLITKEITDSETIRLVKQLCAKVSADEVKRNGVDIKQEVNIIKH